MFNSQRVATLHYAPPVLKIEPLIGSNCQHIVFVSAFLKMSKQLSVLSFFKNTEKINDSVQPVELPVLEPEEQNDKTGQPSHLQVNMKVPVYQIVIQLLEWSLLTFIADHINLKIALR